TDAGRVAHTFAQKVASLRLERPGAIDEESVVKLQAIARGGAPPEDIEWGFMYQLPGANPVSYDDKADASVTHSTRDRREAAALLLLDDPVPVAYLAPGVEDRTGEAG